MSRRELIAPGPGRSASAALRDATEALHRRAERSGITRDMLRGTADRQGYAMLLRALLPAYEALEVGLTAFGPAGVAWAVLRRAPALAADLAALCGPDWAAMPAPPAAWRYRARVMRAAGAARAGEGIAPLLAHAYVRYLGDLSGGQILRRRLRETLDLPDGALAFHDFPLVADIADCKRAFRAALDQAGAAADDARRLIGEARVAFRLNISVSEAVWHARRAELQNHGLPGWPAFP